jgi:hypothetical protein
MASDTRPSWQLDLLQQPVWSRHELVCALWGEDPNDGVTPEQRLQADRAITAGIDAGSLIAGRSSASDERHWADLARGEPVDYEYQAFRRDDAIAWAVATGFERFPFTLADLPSPSPSASIPPELQPFVTGLIAAWTEWRALEPEDQTQGRLTDLLSKHIGIGERRCKTLAAILRPPDAARKDGRSRR